MWFSVQSKHKKSSHVIFLNIVYVYKYSDIFSAYIIVIIPLISLYNVYVLHHMSYSAQITVKYEKIDIEQNWLFTYVGVQCFN